VGQGVVAWVVATLVYRIGLWTGLG
jgi:hypothetical protein